MSRQLPNALTLLRILLTPLIALQLVADRFALALALVLLAGLSDLLDGWLARRYGWQTRLGGLLDPIADKLLVNTCFAGLWWTGALPGWLVALVFARDVVIVAGACAFHWLIRPLQAAPTSLGKLNTVVQIGFILFCLLMLSVPNLPSRLIDAGVFLVAAVALASGADYVVRYAHRALRESSQERRE